MRLNENLLTAEFTVLIFQEPFEMKGRLAKKTKAGFSRLSKPSFTTIQKSNLYLIHSDEALKIVKYSRASIIHTQAYPNVAIIRTAKS